MTVPARHTKKDGLWFTLKHDMRKHWSLYLMILPVIIFFLVWSYGPMYGIQLAFRDFRPREGIAGSPWVGLDNFRNFFGSVFAWRVIRNTFVLSFYNMLWGFPIPIIFALMLNEIRNMPFKRTIQTISYMPFFIAPVVIAGIFVSFGMIEGVFGEIQGMLGRTPVNLWGHPHLFRTMFNSVVIWQGFGFGSIIYLAALSGVNPELFEAARIDGASRLRQIWHVSLPGIMPTIAILLILRVGGLLSVNVEMILLLYNDLTMDTADVIGTFVFRRGLINFHIGFATAVGLFNSVANFMFLLIANFISNKLSGSGLW